MDQTFKLKNGELLINDKGLLISDDARKQRLRWFFLSILWIFYGTGSVIRFIKMGDQFFLWTGLIIGISHLVVLVSTLLKTDKKELLFSEITLIKERKRFNRFIDIRLKNNRVRRIMPLDNSNDIFEKLEASLMTRQ